MIRGPLLAALLALSSLAGGFLLGRWTVPPAKPLTRGPLVIGAGYVDNRAFGILGMRW